MEPRPNAACVFDLQISFIGFAKRHAHDVENVGFAGARQHGTLFARFAHATNAKLGQREAARQASQALFSLFLLGCLLFFGAYAAALNCLLCSPEPVKCRRAAGKLSNGNNLMSMRLGAHEPPPSSLSLSRAMLSGN